MKRFQLIFGVLTLLTASSFTQTAQARGFISFGIGIAPGYYHGPGPYYYGYGNPYYPYYPYYYAPPPVVVYGAAPSVIVRQQPPASESLPAPAPSIPNPPPPPSVIPTQNVAPAQTRVDALIARLNDPSESVRRDAAMDLGRMKAQKAVDSLVQLLSKDASPIARDGAARALGLIAAPRSLNALIYAAQADNDRDVRHSAQFAVEIIRTNLKGN